MPKPKPKKNGGREGGDRERDHEEHEHDGTRGCCSRKPPSCCQDEDGLEEMGLVIVGKLDRILRAFDTLNERIKQMALDMTAVNAKVERAGTIAEGWDILMKAIVKALKQCAASGGGQAEMQAEINRLAAALEASNTKSSDALVAGTAAMNELNNPPGPAVGSTVTASPTTVPADGSAVSTITVTIKAANGTPLSGQTVSLAATLGTVTQPASPTDANGQATGTIGSTSAGVGTVTATNTTDGLVVTQTVDVTFA